MNTSTVGTRRPVSGGRTWRFPRLIIGDHVALAALLWLGFMVTVIGVAVGTAYFNEVTESVLGYASTFVPWYVAFMSGYIVYQYVPLSIAHGRIRRDCAVEAVVFMVVFAAAVALLMVASYLVEYVVYELADWPRDLAGTHLFSSHTDVLAIFWEYWLTFLVWASAGGFAGAAFYRYDAGGWLALIPAGALVSLAGMRSGPTFMGFIFRWLPSLETTSIAVFTVVAIAGFAIGLAITWPILRDVPIHKR